MKASEVRIGNLVRNNLNGEILKTCDVLCDGINTDKIEGLNYGFIEPIPLTEEWLLKFGFQLRDGFSNTFKLNVEKHQYDCSEITYSEKEGLLRFSNGKEKGTTLIPHIKYVHQLQNLYFALTGEELSIKQQEQ